MISHKQLIVDQEEEEDVAESLGLLDLGDSDPQQTILFQLPSVLPSPAKEIKSEPLDRRRRLGVTQTLEHQPALSLRDLPPGKVFLPSYPTIILPQRTATWKGIPPPYPTIILP
jgi:hypothetical protein